MFRDELSSTSGTLSESDRKAILLRCGEARWATDQATRGDCCDPCFRRVKLNWRWRFCQASENCSLLLSVRFVSITRGATYLCETTSYTPFTTGRIQQIVKQSVLSHMKITSGHRQVFLSGAAKDSPSNRATASSPSRNEWRRDTGTNDRSLQVVTKL